MTMIFFRACNCFFLLLVAHNSQVYLLELARVVEQLPGEKNYHIFGLLWAAENQPADSALLDIKKKLAVLGFSTEEIKTLFSVSRVLHLLLLSLSKGRPLASEPSSIPFQPLVLGQALKAIAALTDGHLDDASIAKAESGLQLPDGVVSRCGGLGRELPIVKIGKSAFSKSCILFFAAQSLREMC